MGVMVSPQPKLKNNHRSPDHNDDICHIENASVERTNANENKITNESMPRNAVNHVAHSSCPNQSKANKDKPTKPTSKHEIRQQAEQANAHTDGKYCDS